MKDPKHSNATILNLLRQVKQVIDSEETEPNSIAIQFINNLDSILITGGLYNERIN